MGNNSSSASNQNYSNVQFNPNDWTVEDEPSATEMGKYVTLRNIHNGHLIDKYDVYFSSEEDYENFLMLYEIFHLF